MKPTRGIGIPMTKKTRAAFDTIIKTIDEVSLPTNLNKSEYKNLLEEIIFHLEGNLDAVTSELNESS